MSRKDEGVLARVEEVCGGDVFRLVLEDGREVKAYRAGRMKINKVSVFVGDRVRVVLDPYGGKATNRITYRL